jgi:hypothetical protein
MIYLRARYYAPGQGRFTSRDLWEGDLKQPHSFNKWLYVYGNPVNFTDPTGLLSCKDSDDLVCQSKARSLLTYAKAIKIEVTQGNILPVDAFAKFLDHAMFLFENDYHGMMWGTSNVLLGLDPNEHRLYSLAVPFNGLGYGKNNGKYYVEMNWLPYKNNPSKDKSLDDPHSERGDWRNEYWDGTANQAFHFWYYVASTFYDSDILPVIGNMVHDPYGWEDCLGDDLEKIKPIPIVGSGQFLFGGTSFEDYQLSGEGMRLGRALWFAGSPILGFGFPEINPGNWVRAYLKDHHVLFPE